MGALRQSRSFNTDMSASSGHSQTTSISGNPSGVYVPSVSQGLPTLIVMIVVLVIIVMFCFWGAPAVRAFCRRKICCCCPMDEPNLDSASIADGSATPTIILLPYGRMLVVDRNVFAQLQADHTGIDFMELSANLIRAQRLQTGSNPSILDSDATSKGLSPTSIDFLPPAYEDIFGNKNSDLPPSYSEISMMFRKMSAENSERVSVASVSEINVQKVDSGNSNGNGVPEIGEKDAVNSGAVDGGVRERYFIAPTLRSCSSAPFVFKEGECEFTRQLKESGHGFSSLENNAERNYTENEYNTNSRRRSAENNGAVEEIRGGGGFNQNAINKRLHSEPKVGNCSFPEDDEAKSVLDGRNDPAPCVQYLQSCNERRGSKSGESENANEYVDRESSV